MIYTRNKDNIKTKITKVQNKNKLNIIDELKNRL